MPTLLQIHEFATGAPQLQQRFQGARLQAAWDVQLETSAVPNVNARKAWATKIFTNYEADLRPEYLRFLSVSTIQATGNTATDNVILAATSVLINTFASP